MLRLNTNNPSIHAELEGNINNIRTWPDLGFALIELLSFHSLVLILITWNYLL